MKITLIGLGICEGDLTLRAKTALDNAVKIIARTGEGESFKSLAGYGVETLDYLYESSRNFDTLNKKLRSAVLQAAKQSPVCYCVDGAVCEDEACKIILSKHKDCEIIEGVSKASHAHGFANLKNGCVTCVSAYSVSGLKSCPAVCVYDIDCDLIAGSVKQKLSDIFGEETECAFVRGGKVKRIKLYELDRQRDYDGTCAVAVEEAEFLKRDRYDYSDLEQMIRLLRAPGGCPWDRVQTSESIKSNMIEEAYELVDAIERGDVDGIEEETGDVLLQAAFHSVMEEEKGEFTGTDAITRVIKKLIFRHSHIFGGDKAASESEALGVWDKNKREEKGQNTFTDSVLAVPKNFPSCMYAQKVQKRAAKSGMDFLSPVSASERLFDEVKELVEALINEDSAGAFEEAGDVLFSAVNTCRLAGVDCEDALRASTMKFADRFAECERLIIADGKDITKLDELELDAYWEERKMNLKSVNIGGLHTDNNVFCAPLAGYTNSVFRGICRGLGAGLTFTEMVSAKGLCFKSEKTEQLLHVSADYDGIKACQIFGNDPYYMRKACESEALAPFELVDINMGCPVPKIYKNGEERAYERYSARRKIISECKERKARFR